MRADPVRHRLRPGCLDVGVVGCAEHGNEQLCLTNFTTETIDDGEGLPGIIDKQFLAGRVGLPHGDRQLANPGAVLLAEPAIAIAVRMIGFVFLPQQVKGDTLLAVGIRENQDI